MRDRSWAFVRSLGLPINEALPAIAPVGDVRGASLILDRLFVLHAVAAVAHGFSAERAKAWLEQEALEQSATLEEQRLLDGVGKDFAPYQEQVEAMWALFWFLGLVPVLDLETACSDNFANELPDFRSEPMASTAEWRRRAQPRNSSELQEALDGYVCLGWAFDQANLLGRPAPQLQHGAWVVHRLRALQWLAGSDSWVEPVAIHRKW